MGRGEERGRGEWIGEGMHNESGESRGKYAIDNCARIRRGGDMREMISVCKQDMGVCMQDASKEPQKRPYDF